MQFIDPTTLSLKELFEQLGMTDYVYVQTSNYIDELEKYRKAIFNQIGVMNNGNSESVDDPAELRVNNGKQDAGSILAD